MTEAKPMFKLLHDGEAVVIKILQPSITDQLEVEEFGSNLKRIAGEFPARLIVLNCVTLEFLSSSALGAIIETNLVVKDKKGELRIARLNDNLKQVFKITNLDTIIPLVDYYRMAIVE